MSDQPAVKVLIDKAYFDKLEAIKSTITDGKDALYMIWGVDIGKYHENITIISKEAALSEAARLNESLYDKLERRLQDYKDVKAELDELRIERDKLKAECNRLEETSRYLTEKLRKKNHKVDEKKLGFFGRIFRDAMRFSDNEN